MNSEKLCKLIESLAGDIDFEYNGNHGSVCPFNSTDIALSYGEEAHNHTSVSDAMNDKIFDGKCLNEIAEQIELM